MSSRSPNLQLLGETLTRYYRLACELYNTYPIGRFTNQLSKGNLELNLAEVDIDHLEALCHMFQNKLSPLYIHIYVSALKEVGVRVIHRVLQGLTICLSKSFTLTTLELNNVRLNGKSLNIFCQGIMKSQNLKTLSLRKCNLGDTGVQQVCQNMKNVPSITQLCLIDCQLAEKGASAVACLIQHQRMNRDSAMWQDTLRLRQPHLDGMKGLRRITLNHNPQMNDSGAIAIANALTEDLWIKALDLQHCGIGAEGGQVLRNVLNVNQTLEILDLRQNPFIPNHLVEEVKEVLQERQDEYDVQYMWLEPSDSYVKEEAVKTKGSPGKYSATGRINRIKKGLNTIYTQPKKIPNPPGQLGIPWRVEHRLFERREGLPPGSLVEAFPKEQQSHAVTSTEDSVSLLNIRKQLSLYKRKYRRERERRRHSERKLSRLQVQLQEIHLLDEETVSHIEACFLKFQNFLTLLQNNGFSWQPTFFQESETKQNEASEKLQSGSSLSTLPGSEFGVLTIKAKNSQSPSNIPIPIFFDKRSYTKNGLSPKEVGDTATYIQTQKFMQDTVPQGFPLNLKSKEKTEDIVPDKKDEVLLEQLNSDIKVGRSMLSIFSQYSVPKVNREIIVRSGPNWDKIIHDIPTGDDSNEIHTRDKEHIFNEVNGAGKQLSNGVESFERKFSDEIVDASKKKLHYLAKSTGILPEVEESSKRKLPHKVNGAEVEDTHKKVSNTVKSTLTVTFGKHLEQDKTYKLHDKYDTNTNCRINDDIQLAHEKELVMSGWKTGNGITSMYDDINKTSPVVEYPRKMSPDIINTKRNKEAEQIDLKLKNTQDNMELESVLMSHNALVDLSKVSPDSDDYTVSSHHINKEKDQSNLYEAKQSVKVNNCQNLADKFQLRDKTRNKKQVTKNIETGLRVDISETDDDKLRMQKASSLLLNRSGSASSSVSISEHLSQSHFHWCKGTNKTEKGNSEPIDKTPKEETRESIDNSGGMYSDIKMEIPQFVLVQTEPISMEYGSDFEVSDVEGVSISSASLATTSIPEDLLTPGEEEF
ncbi:uncharacterized protein [Cherax quadricarinatus]